MPRQDTGPADSLFTRKLVEGIRAETLHGGVSLTMAAVHEGYWVQTLRKLVKSVRSSGPGPLPTDRTQGGASFEVIGTDFAGPIYCKLARKQEGKAYLVIFSCCLSRAVHL